MPNEYRDLYDGQRAEVERLRKALEEFAEPANWSRSSATAQWSWEDTEIQNPRKFAEKALESK